MTALHWLEWLLLAVTVTTWVLAWFAALRLVRRMRRLSGARRTEGQA